MTTINRAPSANHSFSGGTVAYTGGSADYTNLTDSDDGTYASLDGSSAYGSWPLVDMPAELGTVTGVVINIREAQSSSFGDFAQLQSVQIFKSDGSTALTSSVTATDTTTPTTFNLTPATIHFSDKTSWNGAVVKVLQDPGSDAGIRIYKLDVDITYDSSAPGTGDNQNASIFLPM